MLVDMGATSRFDSPIQTMRREGRTFGPPKGSRRNL